MQTVFDPLASHAFDRLLARITTKVAASAFPMGAVAAFLSVLIFRIKPGDRQIAIRTRHRRKQLPEIVSQG
jgi:hypothetical protein